jgi:hypothetical protein
MCLSALPMLAPSASAAPIAVTNDRIGDRVVFQQDYSTMFQVPDNMWLGLDTQPQTTNNVTLSYNYAKRAVEYNAVRGAVGKLYIGGLSPAVQTDITMDVEFSRSNFNSLMNVYYGHGQIAIQLQKLVVPDGGQKMCLVIYSYYYDPDLTNENLALTDPIYPRAPDGADSLRFNLTISSDGIAGTNSIYIDGIKILETPISSVWTRQYEPNAFANPYLYFVPTVSSAETGVVGLAIRSIAQTVPAYQYVTPISNPSIMPYGLDGPHPYGTVDEGIALLQQYGGRGTIWADVGDLASYSEDNITALKQLIADGWELGIHYSTELSNKPMEQAIEIMRSEHATITEMFGQSPTSWCSLRNNDNVTHANYAYANLGMVWRNGAVGVHGQSNVGNLCDAVWTWWANASAAGMVYPTFTHQTDPDPAITFSISMSNYETWLDNYAAAGVRLVPWYDYWTIAQNTYHTQVSDLSIENGKALSFTIDNIGGSSRLFVAAPFAEIVVDGNGNEIPYEVVDDGIIMEVEAGEYQVMTMSAYRADQIDRAISPLYTVIPVVIVLAVIGGLITMVGRIKL